MLPCPKHLPMAEKCPAHHQNFFVSTIGPRGFQKKRRNFYPYPAVISAILSKISAILEVPKKPKNPKFRPILAKKQHLLKNFFTNFFCVSWRISTEILMIIPPIPAELSSCQVCDRRIVTASCLAPHGSPK